MSEVENLKKELDANKSGIEGLLSQLDASKQMFNEAASTNFQLRTQLISLNKMLIETDKQLKEALKKLASYEEKCKPSLEAVGE